VAQVIIDSYHLDALVASGNAHVTTMGLCLQEGSIASNDVFSYNIARSRLQAAIVSAHAAMQTGYVQYGDSMITVPPGDRAVAINLMSTQANWLLQFLHTFKDHVNPQDWDTFHAVLSATSSALLPSSAPPEFGITRQS
jgi:hypothetical protein